GPNRGPSTPPSRRPPPIASGTGRGSAMRARRLTTALVSVMALVALAGVAQGSAGQPVIQGQSNNAGATTTSLIASGPGASLAVRNTAAGTALSATTSDGAHYGVV